MTCSSQHGRCAPHRRASAPFRVVTLLFCCVLMGLVGCTSEPQPADLTPTPASEPTTSGSTQPNAPTLIVTVPANTPVPTLAPTPFQVNYVAGVLPTPDPPKPIKNTGAITTTYLVQRGDTIGGIAVAVNLDVETLRLANGLTVRQADRIRAGQTLLIPRAVVEHAPTFKLIPDSELVNSPTAIDFKLDGYVNMQRGYLNNYTEDVAGETLTGAQVVQRVAEQFSVHPRLLLALIEYSSGWVTNLAPTGDQLLYPLGWKRTNLSGLYIQLNWAAARLNEGYYGWRLDSRYIIRLDGGGYVFVGNTINAGTAGLQNYLGAIHTQPLYADAMGPNGFIQTYIKLFGDPWQYDIGQLVPAGLKQVPLALPWKKGEIWYFTGGPHSSWGNGTPWGALDFAPESTAGCTPLDDWTTAMADGRIVRSVNGEVVQSLDSRQDERAGWSVLYMHIGNKARVPAGTWLALGDRIGHPSCQGGVAPAAHIHVARKYNGEWINSDGAIPFDMGGWLASKDDSAQEYNGLLKRQNQTREACECKVNRTNGIGW